MNKLRRIDEGLARGEAALMAVTLLAMVVVASVQALLRNCSDMGMVWASQALPSIHWVDPFLMKGTLWLAFLGASLATREDKHIAIDVLPRLAPPKVRAAMRGLVGLAVSVICIQYGRVIMRTILNNAREVPLEYEVFVDAGRAHICDAPASAFTEGLTRPDIFCGVRSALEAIHIPVATPEAALDLIVAAIFVFMAIRFFGNGIGAFLSIPKGGDLEPESASESPENAEER